MTLRGAISQLFGIHASAWNYKYLKSRDMLSRCGRKVGLACAWKVNI
jgi:hypothetical protein